MEYFSFEQLQLVLQWVSHELYRSIPIFSTDNIFTLKHLKITGYKWSNNLINKIKIFYFIRTLHRKFIERTFNYPTCRANLHNFMQCTLTYKCKTSPKEQWFYINAYSLNLWTSTVNCFTTHNRLTIPLSELLLVFLHGIPDHKS